MKRKIEKRLNIYDVGGNTDGNTSIPLILPEVSQVGKNKVFENSENDKKRKEEFDKEYEKIVNSNYKKKEKREKISELFDKYSKGKYLYHLNYHTPIYDEMKENSPFFTDIKTAQKILNNGKTTTGSSTSDFILNRPIYDSDIKDAKNWLFEWFTNQTTQNILKENAEPASYYFDDKEVKDIPEDELLTDLVALGLSTPVFEGRRPGDELGGLANVTSQTFSGDPFVALNANSYDQMSKNSIAVHELTHILSDLLGYKNSRKGSYNKQESELYARLLELRKALDLNPDKRDYTEDDVNTIVNFVRELKKSGHTSVASLGPLLDIPVSELQNMLNTWASNTLDTQPDRVSLPAQFQDDIDSYGITQTNDVAMAKDGGRLNVNKFTEGGEKQTMSQASSAVAKKAFSKENVGSTLASGLGTAMTLVDNAMKNAEVDTSSANNAIAATNAFQTDNSSLDALANSYDSAPWAATDYNFKDFRPGAGELAMNTVNSTISGLSSGASMGGPWGAVAGAAVGLGSALGGVFAGRAKAKKEEARLEAEAKLANQSIQARAEASRDALIQQQANQNLMNIAAYGGSLGNFSGDFSNGVMFIDEGGTHEQNPFEGVPMGFDNQGTPNLVEQGEIIYNDYVFSNRLKANKKGLENIGFSDKYKNWTFAAIAEDLQKESAERPNDILSKQTLDDMMGRLVQVQEEVRNKRKDVQEKKAQAAAEQMFANGGDVNILEGKNTEQTTTGMSPEVQKALYDLYNGRLGFTYDNLGPSYRDYDVDGGDPFEVNYVEQALARKENEDKGYTWDGKTGLSFIPENVGGVDDPAHKAVVAYKLGLPKEKTPEEKTFDWTKFGNDALRIGAPLAAGISALAQNLAKPDYSQNERALNEARTAPTSNIVAPTENINIRPVDTNYMINMLRNQGNTNISNIGNTAINAQQAMANQMLANNQLQGQLANAYMQANEANLNRSLQESEFNRGNDQFITQTAFQNFANNAARHNTIVNATAQAAAANSALDAARAQGILASESNIAESLAGVGSENHWSNVIKDAPWLLYDSQGRFKNPVETIGTTVTPGTDTTIKAHGGRILDGVTEGNQTITNTPYLTTPLNIQNPLMKDVNVVLNNRDMYTDTNSLDYGLTNINAGIARANNDVINQQNFDNQMGDFDATTKYKGQNYYNDKDIEGWQKDITFNLDNADIERNVTNPYGNFIGNVMLSTNQLNNTDRALRAKRRAERYARRHGATDEDFGNVDVKNIILDPTLDLANGSSFRQSDGQLLLGINYDNSLNVDPRKLVAHELSHRNKLYNTRVDKNDKGQYIMDANPDYIRKKHQRWLTPTEQEALDNAHDSKLNENFADLEALRLGMKDLELDGTRRYTNRDIKDYMNYLEESGMTDRYLNNHTNINRVRKALNRVYDKGGKLLTSNKKRRK